MKNEFFKLYNGLYKGEKIKVVLSTGLTLYVCFTDSIQKNTNMIVIIRNNGVRVVINPEHIVMLALVVPRR